MTVHVTRTKTWTTKGTRARARTVVMTVSMTRTRTRTRTMAMTATTTVVVVITMITMGDLRFSYYGGGLGKVRRICNRKEPPEFAILGKGFLRVSIG